jgi:hypothetical protein
MVAYRIVVLLVLVILGSNAVQELWRAVAPLIPMIIIFGIVAALMIGAINLFRSSRW